MTEMTFVQGPSLGPGLRDWLVENAGASVLRLPVTLESDGYEITSTYIEVGDDRILLEVDDSKTSLSLDDTIGFAGLSYPTVVWLEGTVGETFRSDNFASQVNTVSRDEESDILVFSMLRYVGPAEVDVSNIYIFGG